MRRGEDLSIFGKMKGAVLVALISTPALAGDYACKGWDAPHQGEPKIEALSVGTSMITYRAINGFATTARMTQSTLTRRVYPDDASVWVVHGDFVRGADGPEFGPEITLQRLVHDRDHPFLAITTCEASQ